MRKAKTTSGIDKKINRIRRSLDAIECGRYSELTYGYCCDYIAWLAKFKKVPESVWSPLCDQAVRIADSGILRFVKIL